MKANQMLFLTMMIMGSILTMSSESWLGIWMGLEINMMSFIPILFKKKKANAAESSMMYFIIQSISSMIMLMTIIINPSFCPLTLFENWLFLPLLFSIMIKAAIPPFHFWFPEIMKKMEWGDCFLIMTWQKLAPMTALSYIMPNNWLTPVIVIMTVTAGAVGGINQTSIHKIMAFSSINHAGWMICCMQQHDSSWLQYLSFYSLIVLMMIFFFQKYSISYINQLNMSKNTILFSSNIIILFLSMGGLPPFLGFYPKWMIIQTIMNSNSYLMLSIMVMTSLITLFYYLRIINSMILMSTPSWKWMKKSNSHTSQGILLFLNLSLPLSILLL